jgi:hypothetical protein
MGTSPSFDPVRFAERLASWLVPRGADSDVVVSSRVRLARNVEEFPFVPKLSPERARELCERLRPQLESFAVGGPHALGRHLGVRRRAAALPARALPSSAATSRRVPKNTRRNPAARWPSATTSTCR